MEKKQPLCIAICELGKKECNSRESNPGLIRGRDLSYHLTTIAVFGVFMLVF